MPTYEYLCKACSHRFEAWQKMTDEPLTICPECGGHIRRVLYPAGIVFKGSGFYKTDHPGNASANANGANGETKSTEGTTSTESKPASESKSTESTPSSSTSESKPAATNAA